MLFQDLLNRKSRQQDIAEKPQIDNQAEQAAHDERIRAVRRLHAADALTAAVSGEIAGTVGIIGTEIERVEESIQDAIGAASEVSDKARSVAGAAKATVGDVQTVAAATEELAASAHQIAAMMDKVSTLSSEAVGSVAKTSDIIGGMVNAAEAISGVLVLIETIAKRTNMLALNASIEAQRAGSAGKGFAVVAGEVKDLAAQTRAATQDIQTKITGIERTSAAAAAAIVQIGQAVDGIRAISGEAAIATGQQTEATREISKSAHKMTTDVNQTLEDVVAIGDYANRATEKADDVKQRESGIAAALAGMTTRLSAVVSASTASRSALRRLDLDMPAGLDLGGRNVETRLLSISPEGALFRCDHPLDLSRGALVLPWLGSFTGTLRPRPDGNTALIFDDVERMPARMLERMIDRLDILDLWVFSIAEEGRRRTTEAFEQAIDSGDISMADLFDEDYRPIDGTNPVQHMTRFTALADRILPPIQEPLLARDPRLYAVCATDRNGYVPTNNRYCSKPQGADPVWNAANCRSRKMLPGATARAAELAADSSERYVITSYIREVATGDMRMLRNLAMPIRIHGRYWGATHVTFGVEPRTPS